MRRFPFVFLLLLLTTSFYKGHAQAASDSSQRNSTKWLLPTVVLAYSAATYLVYRHADAPFRRYVQRHRSPWKSKLSRAVTDFGLGRSQTIGLGATAAAAWIFKDTRLKKTAIVWLGSLLVNSTVTERFKNSFQRHRPNTGDPYNTFDWRHGPRIHRSFISAHTSNIFTTATVLSLNYRHKKWVPPVAYGLATLVGLSRVYDDAHWASDVMGGAAIGYLSGKLVEMLYKRLSPKIQFLPQPSRQGGGALTLLYQW